MAKTVLGIFDNGEDAENAIDSLKNGGYDPKEISIFMKDREKGSEIAKETGVDVATGAVAGATTGTILGGLAGLISSIALPGLGAFFIGGPIATALGLTGAAASTVSGAATGALAGGILGILTGFGVPKEDAELYERRIGEGGILVAVPAHEGEESSVENILNEHNADDVKMLTLGEEITNRPAGKRTKRSFEYKMDRNFDDRGTPAYAYQGVKGGKAFKKGKTGSKSKRGWHGDSKGHSMAAKGEDVPGRGEGK